MSDTAPRYVPGVSVYTIRGHRSMTPAEALTYLDQHPDEDPLILGAMREGHLGREMVTLTDLRRWTTPLTPHQIDTIWREAKCEATR